MASFLLDEDANPGYNAIVFEKGVNMKLKGANRLCERTEIELIKAYQSDRLDPETQAKVVDQYSLYVYDIALRRARNCVGLKPEDLFSPGVVGLLIAAERFDTQKGIRFTTFATYWINQQMQVEIETGDRMIRLPRYQVWQLTRINKAIERLVQRLERTPTILEISLESGIKIKDIENLEQVNIVDSLDDPLPENFLGSAQEGGLRGERDDKSAEFEAVLIEKLARQSALQDALERCTPMQRAVVRMKYGLDTGVPMSNPEVGKQFRVSAEAIRLILGKAHIAMRQSRELQEFVNSQ